MKRIHVLPFVLAFLLLPAAARAQQGAKLESWSVVGMRDEAASDLGAELAALRGALSLELSARGRGVVRDEEETRLRLGAAGTDLRAVRDRIDAAELYFFQLELDVARTNLEQALAALVHASGLPRAWEHTRDARMLLGMVHLAERTQESRRRAIEQFAAVARVQPAWSPADASYPAEVIELYAEARDSLPPATGTLRAVCAPACPGGQVFVDTFPAGAPGQPIALAPGSYRVVVADRADAPRRRSLLREIEVAGGETEVRVDLPSESPLVGREGTALELPADAGVRRQAAAQLAQRLGTDFTLVLLASTPTGRAGWLVDAQGRVVREMALAKHGDDAAVELAQLATSDALPSAPAQAASASGSRPPAVETRANAAPPAVDRTPAGWQVARWATVGGAVLAASAGAWVHLDAAHRDDAMRTSLERSGGVLPSDAVARATRAEADAIRSQERLGNGLLLGAGVLTATAVTLFFLDFGEVEPAVHW